MLLLLELAILFENLVVELIDQASVLIKQPIVLLLSINKVRAQFLDLLPKVLDSTRPLEAIRIDPPGLCDLFI